MIQQSGEEDMNVRVEEINEKLFADQQIAESVIQDTIPKQQESTRGDETKLTTNSKIKTKSPIRKTILNIKKRLNAIFLRLLFMSIPSYHIYLLSCIYDEPLYYLLFLIYGILIFDGLWVAFKRGGHDYYWFSPTYAAFTTLMAFIIDFETEIKYQKEDVRCETNSTMLGTMAPTCMITFNSNMCTVVEIFVVAFLSTLVIGRWIMRPSKRMDKEAIYMQVANFTTLSADVIEIAQYMQNKEVADSYGLMKACQVIFSLSLVQFCFSLSAVKERNMNLSGFRKAVDVIFSTEAWSLLLALFTQELPCFVLRIILLVSITSRQDVSLYFFVLKNGLMSFLLLYRVGMLNWRMYQSELKIVPLIDQDQKSTIA